MKPLTLSAIAAALLLAMQALAQSPALPQTYAFTAASNMMGPMTVTVHRNASRELVEMAGTAGGLHVRQLYDFQAHRVYTVDLNVNRCTTQEYVSPYAPVFHDPIGGAEEMVRQVSSLPVVSRETVNGVAVKLVEAPLSGAQGKYRFWLEEKFGFPIKQTVIMGTQPERVLFEMRQISYAPSAATLFTPPADCTRIAGVTNANGGSAQMDVNVNVQAQAQSGPAGASTAKQAAQPGGGQLVGKWDFTGKDGAGTQWSGTLTIQKLTPDSFDPAKYSNECELDLASANSGKGVGGPCLYDPRTKTFSFAGGGSSSKYSFTAILSPDGASLTQGRWVEGGTGSWSATSAQPKR